MKLSELLQETSKYKKFSVDASFFYMNKIMPQTFIEAYQDKNKCKLKMYYDMRNDKYEFKRF